MDVNTNKKFCLKVHDKTQNMRDQKNIYLLFLKITFVFPFIIFQAASFNPDNKLIIKIFSNYVPEESVIHKK